jgi:hypothetical protein
MLIIFDVAPGVASACVSKEHDGFEGTFVAPFCAIAGIGTSVHNFVFWLGVIVFAIGSLRNAYGACEHRAPASAGAHSQVECPKRRRASSLQYRAAVFVDPEKDYSERQHRAQHDSTGRFTNELRQLVQRRLEKISTILPPPEQPELWTLSVGISGTAFLASGLV